ncbi:CorA family divalent cation transporter [Marinifilum flexuosum]|uniref:CorA family divalent cation transporter n=1 Tax=Marinifilum flexuosum TaxID=1117708 RepID=UPI000E7214EF|nr:CorA family divalent cation transporter [Marinifilum flexuosum]
MEKDLEIRLFSAQDREEIETSSKYIENEKFVGLNLIFLSFDDDEYKMDPVSFILKDRVLITQREREYKSFEDVLEKLNSLELKNGVDLLLSLLETRIDIDADLIELITDDINKLNKVIAKEIG